MDAEDETAMRGAYLVLRGSRGQAKYGERFVACHVGARPPRWRLRPAPVHPEPPVEIRLEDTQGVGIAATVGMQVQEVGVGQHVQTAPGEAALDHPATDVASCVI